MHHFGRLEPWEPTLFLASSWWASGRCSTSSCNLLCTSSFRKRGTTFSAWSIFARDGSRSWLEARSPRMVARYSGVNAGIARELSPKGRVLVSGLPCPRFCKRSLEAGGEAWGDWVAFADLWACSLLACKISSWSPTGYVFWELNSSTTSKTQLKSIGLTILLVQLLA